MKFLGGEKRPFQFQLNVEQLTVPLGVPGMVFFEWNRNRKVKGRSQEAIPERGVVKFNYKIQIAANLVPYKVGYHPKLVRFIFYQNNNGKSRKIGVAHLDLGLLKPIYHLEICSKAEKMSLTVHSLFSEGSQAPLAIARRKSQESAYSRDKYRSVSPATSKTPPTFTNDDDTQSVSSQYSDYDEDFADIRAVRRLSRESAMSGTDDDISDDVCSVDELKSAADLYVRTRDMLVNMPGNYVARGSVMNVLQKTNIVRGTTLVRISKMQLATMKNELRMVLNQLMDDKAKMEAEEEDEDTFETRGSDTSSDITASKKGSPSHQHNRPSPIVVNASRRQRAIQLRTSEDEETPLPVGSRKKFISSNDDNQDPPPLVIPPLNDFYVEPTSIKAHQKWKGEAHSPIDRKYSSGEETPPKRHFSPENRQHRGHTPTYRPRVYASDDEESVLPRDSDSKMCQCVII